MSSAHRIRTVYGKELVDILRDRRTLTAMIVVPIVLYPLLMLGSIQAVSFQAETIRAEAIVVGVLSEEQGASLVRLAEADRARIEGERKRLKEEGSSPDSEGPAATSPRRATDDLPEPLELELIQFRNREQLNHAVQTRRVHIGVLFEPESIIDDPAVQNEVLLLSDLEDFRSRFAERRIGDMIARVQERTNDRRKEEAGLPPTFDQPFVLETVDLSSPPSILGQVLPLILILMTITGAIYPAIDVTAGERERGTLESLMVSPVPAFDLIVGKFLVVTTVAIMGAALNLLSVCATVYFGGFDKVIASEGGGMPLLTMLWILLCLIPFAILMSAIMIAVCSYARSFKEAQNYVTPVILAVLIPGGMAALPGTRFEGIMQVMPVGNMVLLARDLLVGTSVSAGTIALVLISTTLYAGAAVAIAAAIFGQESVVFADAGSWTGVLSRKLQRPADNPPISMSLLVTALLFPLWFFVQAAMSPETMDELPELQLYANALLMPVCFVGIPVATLLYWKVRVGPSLQWRVPSTGHLVAGVLLGCTAWIPAYELNLLQIQWFGVPDALAQQNEMLADTVRHIPLWHALLVLALVPAVCEELLFRGFLFTGLRQPAGKCITIAATAAIFAVFHFFIFKFAVTAGLGVLLALLCWQSRSIVPCMVMHLIHNGVGVLTTARPELFGWTGVQEGDEMQHLAMPVLIVGGLVFLVGLGLAMRRR